MNNCRVKIFESYNFTDLEAQINEWLENTSNTVESIAYSAARDSYSALVYYAIADAHKTEPLAE